jgi:hypothetical protein
MVRQDRLFKARVWDNEPVRPTKQEKRDKAIDAILKPEVKDKDGKPKS